MKKIISKNYSWVVVLVVILLLATIVRIIKLTNLPVFGDEAIYIRWSQIMRVEPTLRFIPLSDGKQPLFMWSMMPFLKLFSDPLFAGRLVSVATGVATTAGVFVLSFLLFNSKRLSLMASFIYAIIPFAVFFERLAMADSMLSMFGIWTLILTVLIVKTQRVDVSMLAGFSLAGALLTKSPALYFSILLPLVVFIKYWRDKSVKKTIYNLGLLIIVYLIGYGVYNFLLRLGPNFHMIALRNKDYVFPLSHLWTNPKDPFIPHFDRAIEWFILYGTWPLVLLATAGLIRGVKKNYSAIFILLVWWFVPIVASAMYAKVFTTRYIFFTLPYYVIIAAIAFVDIGKAGKILRWITWLVLFGVLLFSVSFYYIYITDVKNTPLAETDRSGFLVEWTSGTGIKEVSQIIKDRQRQNPDQKIVVGTEGYFGTLPDGLQMYLTDYPQITVIGVGIDLKEVPQSLLESKQAGNETYLVINSSRLKMELASVGELVAQYEKEPRNIQSHEFSLHGEKDYLFLIKL